MQNDPIGTEETGDSNAFLRITHSVMTLLTRDRLTKLSSTTTNAF